MRHKFCYLRNSCVCALCLFLWFKIHNDIFKIKIARKIGLNCLFGCICMNKQKQKTAKFPQTKDKLKIFIALLFFVLFKYEIDTHTHSQ